MCGIFLSVSRGDFIDAAETLRENLDRRGPDFASGLHFASGNENIAVFVSVHASVLALRGNDLVKQPLHRDVSITDGLPQVLPTSCLCWNGEAWSIGGDIFYGNDSSAVFSMLIEAAQEDARSASPPTYVLEALAKIVGPFAFVFVDALNSRIYFGRDCLGRRSLLMKSQESNILVSSVNDGLGNWSEIDANCICMISIGSIEYLRGGTGPDIISQITTFKHKTLTTLNRSLPEFDLENYRASHQVSDELLTLLKKSLHYRLDSINVEGNDLNQEFLPAKIAILFSGGVDCTLLARLADDHISGAQPIDLLNVAFENPRVLKSSPMAVSSLSPYENCPDRITARRSLKELQTVCSGRQWRLIEINIPYQENILHRSRIESLMHPHATEMDLSISSALYFAARGSGYHLVDGQAKSIATDARILLSGLGADELFGGYQRHATAFARCKQNSSTYNPFLDQLDLDMQRLGQRNLGRDDRVISHWGREIRYPFLDERIVDFAAQQPFWTKCAFGTKSHPDGCSLPQDKFLIRSLAQSLGLANIAGEGKRAIQFGARTAKMETGRTKGTDLIHRHQGKQIRDYSRFPCYSMLRTAMMNGQLSFNRYL